jgi:hypothetical protein
MATKILKPNLKRPANRFRFAMSLILILTFHTISYANPNSVEISKDQFSKNITYDLPQNWKLQNHRIEENFETLQFLIPNKRLDQTSLSANAAIIIERNKENLSVEEFGNWKIKTDYPGFALMENYYEGKSWRTAYWTARQGEIAFLIVDRFGISPQFRVQLRVSVPLTNLSSGEWTLTTIKEINDLLKSLKISGKIKPAISLSTKTILFG